MLDELNRLSPDSANLASRTAPETPPATPSYLKVPASDWKLGLGQSASSGTVTGYDVRHMSMTERGVWAAALAAAFALAAGEAPAQTPVCSNSPSAEQRVECEDPADSTADIDIELSEPAIATTAQDAHGVEASHAGEGDVDIGVAGGSVTTAGDIALGVWGRHTGSGNVDIDLRSVTFTTGGYLSHGVRGEFANPTTADNGEDVPVLDADENPVVAVGDLAIGVTGGSITTTGDWALGIWGRHTGSGNVDIDVRSVTFTTGGERSHGVLGEFANPTTNPTTVDNGEDVPVLDADENPVVAVGDLAIGVTGGSITTRGLDATGVFGIHHGAGDLSIGVRDAAVTTESTEVNNDDETVAHGVYGRHSGDGNVDIGVTGGRIETAGVRSHGVYSWHSATGDVDIEVAGGSVTTGGLDAIGVFGLHQGTGDLSIAVRDVAVTTESTEVNNDDETVAHGVYGWHSGDGNVDIGVTGGRIETAGVQSHGVQGLHSGDGNVVIGVTGGRIETAGVQSHGVNSWHSATGDGNVDIGVTGGRIETAGVQSHGVQGLHSGDGNVVIGVTGGRIETAGVQSHGVNSWHSATGDVVIGVTGARIKTTGTSGRGVFGRHTSTGVGDLAIGVTGGRIETAGRTAYGVYGLHEGAGDIRIGLRDAAIKTSGTSAYGVFGWHTSTGVGDLAIGVTGGRIETAGRTAYGVYGWHSSTGDVAIDVTGGRVETAGVQSHGVYGRHSGDGDLAIGVTGARIKTTGTSGRGVYGRHSGVGDLAIGVTGGSIETSGSSARGVYGLHQGAGDIRIGLRDAAIETSGSTAYGVYGWHNSTDNSDGDVVIGVTGGRIETAGRTAYGVYGQNYDDGDIHIGMRGGSIATMGASADGVFAASTSGGRIDILIAGGSVRAAGEDANGIQVGRLNAGTGAVERAALDVDGDGVREQTVRVNGRVWGGQGDAAGVWLAGGGRVVVGPQGSIGADSGNGLLVDLDLDGRRIEKVIGGEVRNDAGGLTVLLNGVDVTDPAAAGVPIPNGAWDIRQLADAAPGFALENFAQSYAPRAAVYEALPGFLLRLDGAGGSPRFAAHGTPVWLGQFGGGSYDPRRASVGAAYDFRSRDIEAGLDFTLGEALGGALTGSFALRALKGSADVVSPTRGGEVEATGLGAAFAASWQAGAWYAAGRATLTRYDLDLSSDSRGALASGVEALGHGLAVEAGRKFVLEEGPALTPRTRLGYAGLSLDGFADRTGARVSLASANRVDASIGVLAEDRHAWQGGALSLHASLDFVRTLGDAETAVDVSGERLRSAAGLTRTLFGLGAVYEHGELSLAATLSAGGLGTGNRNHSGALTLSTRF